MKLFGYPVVPMQTELGPRGDIVFGDFSSYMYWEVCAHICETCKHWESTPEEPKCPRRAPDDNRQCDEWEAKP